MADKVINPDTGEPVTKQFARDMGFLDEAEPYEPEPNVDHSAAEDAVDDMDDFMSGGGFEEELDDVGGPPEGEEIEEQARRLDDIGEGLEEAVQDEEDFFGESFGQRKSWEGGDARPLYTNNTRPSQEKDDDETPEIDKREREWEDEGQTYENTDIGGIRVNND